MALPSLIFSTSTISLAALSAAGLLVLVYGISPYLKFIWYCFLRPIGDLDLKPRLDKFYQGQADVYDSTRTNLLRGRKTMMCLSAAHLRSIRAANPNARLVWCDIGGGTGHNIEMMNEYFPIDDFDAVYLIDLCEPLLQVARERFSKRNWTNVTVLCQDASELYLPEWAQGVDPKASVGFVTLSYSLSMIPNFYPLLDRIDYIVSPNDGLIGVVDFYTAGKQASLHERAIGGISKECGWLSRWFWQIWFDFDHVSLSPARREYLEYKFGTVKTYNGRNRFVLPFVIRIPYYIWLGRPRTCDVSSQCHAFEVEGGNMVGNCSPDFSSVQNTPSNEVTSLDLGQPAMSLGTEKPGDTIIDVTPPLSAFHYHLSSPWRLPYYESPVHKEFRSFIYAFTWEDPEDDMKHLKLKKDDSMFVITSAGDNALHYAIKASPKRIHCVDMNPCQGHLLELKLAAIKALDYEDFFALFGTGKHPNFRLLLDSKIAPHLSSIAYQFWRINSSAFTESFYLHGYSGWALRLARLIFTIAGVSGDVLRMCQSSSLAEQNQIWQTKIRRVLFNPVVIRLLKSRVFCWNALGVPGNQRQMVMDGGGAWGYIRDTFDPVVNKWLLGRDNYFYLLALLGRYTPESCPAYLTREGFDALKGTGSTDAFRLHTDSIDSTLRNLPSSSLTHALVMDHLDWFSEGAPEVDEEVQQIHRTLARGGMCFWRSAARRPWYNAVFERVGFAVSVVGLRSEGKAIDRVNMYASFWKAEKRR